MKLNHSLLLLVLLLLSGRSWAQGEWIDIHDPAEVRAIYTNTTIRGMGFVGYYRADGRGVMTAADRKPQGRRWFVKDDGQGCAAIDAGPTLCYRFQRHRDSPSLIRIRDIANGANFTATVEQGVPDLEPFEKAMR